MTLRVFVEGDRVRRQAGPWTPWVHKLLRALPEGIGPRPVSLDADWEVVTRIDGVVGERPLSDDVRSIEALASVAWLLRRFHDGTGGLVCHNDAGPWNVVFQGRDAVGLIDWDLAGPGDPLDDVAFALWHFVPLYDDDECVRIGWPEPPDRQRRFLRFLSIYGGLVEFEHIRARMEWYRSKVLEARADPGAPGASPWLKVDPALVDRDIDWLVRNAGWIADVRCAG